MRKLTPGPTSCARATPDKVCFFPDTDVPNTYLEKALIQLSKVPRVRSDLSQLLLVLRRLCVQLVTVAAHILRAKRVLLDARLEQRRSGAITTVTQSTIRKPRKRTGFFTGFFRMIEGAGVAAAPESPLRMCSTLGPAKMRLIQ